MELFIEVFGNFSEVALLFNLIKGNVIFRRVQPPWDIYGGPSDTPGTTNIVRIGVRGHHATYECPQNNLSFAPKNTRLKRDEDQQGPLITFVGTTRDERAIIVVVVLVLLFLFVATFSDTLVTYLKYACQIFVSI